MTEESQSLDNNTEIVLDEQSVAAAVLTSESSWVVLEQLYITASQKLMSTQGFVIPVRAQMDVIKTKLKDPEAFQRNFTTLTQDLANLAGRLQACVGTHRDRSGIPSEEDWKLTFTASQEYSNIVTEFDTVVVPLIFSLVEIIRDEYGDLLEKPTAEELPQ